jgi:hypothetical protein
LDVLALELNNHKPELREKSAAALGKIGMAAGSIASGLVRNLDPGNDSRTRNTACASLSLMAEEGAAKLNKALTLEDRRMRTQSTQALGQMGELGAVHANNIAEQLVDSDPILRARAVEAIGSFGHSAAHLATDVAAMLYDSDSGVRTAAGAALPHVCKCRAICTRIALWGISWYNLQAYDHLQTERVKEQIANCAKNNLPLDDVQKTHRQVLEDTLRLTLATSANSLIQTKDIDLTMGPSPFGDTDCVYIEITAYAYDDDTLEEVFDCYGDVDTLQEDLEAEVRRLPFIYDVTDFGEDDIEVECDDPEFCTRPMHYDMVQEVLARAEKQARIAIRGGNGCLVLPSVAETKVDWFMPVKPSSNTYDNSIEAVRDTYDSETREATFQTYYYNKETGKTSWTRKGAA